MTIWTDEMREAVARKLHDRLWGDHGPGKETAYLAMREQLLGSVDAALSAIEQHVAAVVAAARYGCENQMQQTEVGPFCEACHEHGGHADWCPFAVLSNDIVRAIP